MSHPITGVPPVAGPARPPVQVPPPAMSTIPLNSGAPQYVAWGIPFSDERSAMLARTVMRIASAMATIALASVILQFITGYYMSIGILAAVILPLCGYFGAQRRSRFMLSCFTGCNAVLALFFVISFIVTMVDDRNTGRYRTLYWVSIGLAFAMAVLQCAGAYFGFKLLRSDAVAVAAIPVAQPVPYSTYAPQQQSTGAVAPPRFTYAAPQTAYAPPYAA